MHHHGRGRAAIDSGGGPTEIAMWIPSNAAGIKDTWSALGMRSTGSNEFVVDSYFVPATHSYFLTGQPHEKGPLYHPQTEPDVALDRNSRQRIGIARGP
jgi:hypothetical protein